MSPDIQHLFSSAADDEGRPPMRPDLEAIRAQGRRAVLRRRVTTGISGLAVAAVVGSVAVASGAIDLSGGDGGGTGLASGGTGGIEDSGGAGSAYSSSTECGWAGDSDPVPSPGVAPDETWPTAGSDGDVTSYVTLTPTGPPHDPTLRSAPPLPTVDPDGAVFATDQPGAPAGSTSVGEGTAPPPGAEILPPDATTVEVDPNCGEITGTDLTPIEDALGKGGYKVDVTGGLSGGGDAMGGTGYAFYYNKTILEVTNPDGQVGSAVVGAYDSIDALPPEDQQAGVMWCGPAISSSPTFMWDADCFHDPGVATVTAGHDESASILGGFYIRADGTVVGVSLSTAYYDAGDGQGGSTGQPLDALPLDADQLAALITQLAEADTK